MFWKECQKTKLKQKLSITFATTAIRFDLTSTQVLMDQMNYFLNHIKRQKVCYPAYINLPKLLQTYKTHPTNFCVISFFYRQNILLDNLPG